MADYYPLLSRAVSGLDPNTSESRREVYERARAAIVKQLRSYDPPLSESDITRERLALEDAVRKVESDQRVAPAATEARVPVRPSLSPRPSAAAAPSVPPVNRGGMPAAVAASAGAVAASEQMSAAQAAQPVAAAYHEDALPAPDAVVPRPRINPPRVQAGRRGERPDAYLADEGLPANRSRWPAIAAVAAVLLLAALGAWAYFARDQLQASLGSQPAENVAPTQLDPKIEDRIGQSADAPADAAPDASQTALIPDTTAAAPGAASAPPSEAPAETAPSAASLVAQRAILYEETPDQKGGTAFQGSIVWRVERAANNPAETVLRGDVTIPEREISVGLLIQRNTDATLPASHTIDVQFTLPGDFPNGGIGSVPGILFKPSEEVGGAALSGLSVKVTTNFFLIGLSAAPRDVAENLKAMGERAWIDLPLLYDNGRRAVLTMEKGVPGERAFEEALAAWSSQAPVAGGAAQPGVPTPR
ncbi:hypothetical protein [Terrihabitans rhizophilus]|uniref:Histidine kinase n=1 Tax=Terrihabitans rhizophilus TaxID=3092662 RepID=A0ABU4RRI9_9HYPH|nr:hypothetical protein [Terrihabitans sp. PJ23]MDX6807464.1 hypothetical protein [Terrihabitans sp. PJ23]